jgi:hypothetical protein
LPYLLLSTTSCTEPQYISLSHFFSHCATAFFLTEPQYLSLSYNISLWAIIYLSLSHFISYWATPSLCEPQYLSLSRHISTLWDVAPSTPLGGKSKWNLHLKFSSIKSLHQHDRRLSYIAVHGKK